MLATAHDTTNEVHAVKLDGHPFFAAKLLQPERAALNGQLVPLVEAHWMAAGESPRLNNHRSQHAENAGLSVQPKQTGVSSCP